MNSITWTRKVALALIVCAVIGTEVSYHCTLESRFDAIEDKLAQQTIAMQAMQESLDTIESSKNETVSGLNKQIASLQSSFEPMGKTSQAQADALSQVHQQLATLQKAQGDQQDAQMKLSAYLTQLEAAVKKARADAASASSARTAPAPLPLPTTNAALILPVPLPLPIPTPASDLMASPGAVSHPVDHAASDSIQAEALPEATAPRAVAVLDLRPADGSAAQPAVSPRALPVGASLSSKGN
jgi:prefoldin subunit 5